MEVTISKIEEQQFSHLFDDSELNIIDLSLKESNNEDNNKDNNDNKSNEIISFSAEKITKVTLSQAPTQDLPAIESKYKHDNIVAVKKQLQITSKDVRIFNKNYQVNVTFNYDLGDSSLEYPTKLPDFVQPPEIEPPVQAEWSLILPNTIQLQFFDEDTHVYKVIIDKRSIQSILKDEKEKFLKNEQEIIFYFALPLSNPLVFPKPNSHTNLFPKSIILFHADNDMSHLKSFIDCRCNGELVELEPSNYTSFRKQFPYYTPEEYFPESLEYHSLNFVFRAQYAFPDVNEKLSSYSIPEKKNVHLIPVQPFECGSQVVFTIRKGFIRLSKSNIHYIFEEDIVLGSFRVVNPIKVEIQPTLDFLIRQPISDAILDANNILSNNLIITPSFSGAFKIETRNLCYYRIVPTPDITFPVHNVSLRNPIRTILGVPVEFNDTFCTRIVLLRSNLAEYIRLGIPLKPQFYFEFNNEINMESFFAHTSFTSLLNGGDPIEIPLRLVPDNEINCSIIVRHLDNFCVCISPVDDLVIDGVYHINITPGILSMAGMQKTLTSNEATFTVGKFFIPREIIVPQTYKYTSNIPQVSNSPQLLLRFTFPMDFQTIIPYLFLTIHPLSDQVYTLTEVQPGSHHPHIRHAYFSKPDRSVVIKVTPDLPWNTFFALNISEVPGGPAMHIHRYFVSEELTASTLLTHVDSSQPITIAFNQPLFDDEVGDINNILLKDATGAEASNVYINPYYCPTITPNIYGHWTYSDFPYAGGVPDMPVNEEWQPVFVPNRRAKNSMTFTPVTPFKSGNLYQFELLPHKIVSYLFSLTKAFKFELSVGKLTLENYFPKKYSDEHLPRNPMFLLKFTRSVDSASVLALCSIASKNNLSQLELATMAEVEVFIKRMNISESFDPNSKRVVAIIDRAVYPQKSSGTLHIAAGSVSQKNHRLPLEFPVSIRFQIQKAFTYLFFEPPNVLDNRFSSFITLDVDSLIFHFSETLAQVQRRFPKITPAIEGSWIIELNRIIFRPIELWKRATCYSIRIPKTIRSNFGNEMPKRVIVKYDTGLPIPVVKSPLIEELVSSNQVFLVRYGQSMDIQSVIEKAYFKVHSRLRAKIIPVREASEEEYVRTRGTKLTEDQRIRDQNIEVLLAPKDPLPANKEISLIIGTGVKGLGGEKSTEEYQWTFTTEFYFKLTSIYVANPFFLNSSVCRVKFSENLAGLVNENIPIITWNHPDVRVNVRSVYENQISFSIDEIDGKLINEELDIILDCSNILSVNFRNLDPKDFNFPIKANPNTFPCYIQSVYDQLLAVRNPLRNTFDTTYSALVYNIKSVRVCVYRLNESDLLQWARLPLQELPSDAPAVNLKVVGKKILDQVYPIDNFAKNQQSVFTMDLMNIVFRPDQPIVGAIGIMVTTTSKDYFPNPHNPPLIRNVIQFTKIGLTCFTDINYTNIWAFDLVKKKPLNNLEIILWNNDRITTNELGLAKVISKFLKFDIIAKNENDITIVNISKEIRDEKKDVLGFLFTDKDYYYPGDDLYIVGYVREKIIWGNDVESLKHPQLNGVLMNLFCDTPIQRAQMIPLHPKFSEHSCGYFTVETTVPINANDGKAHVSFFGDLSPLQLSFRVKHTKELTQLNLLKRSPHLIYTFPQTEENRFDALKLVARVQQNKSENIIGKWNISIKYDPLPHLIHSFPKYHFGVGNHREVQYIHVEEQETIISEDETPLSFSFDEKIEKLFPIQVDIQFTYEHSISKSYSLLPSPHLIGLSYPNYPHYKDLNTINLDVIVINYETKKMIETDITLIVVYKNKQDTISEKAFDIRSSDTNPISQNIGLDENIQDPITIEILAISDYQNYRSISELVLYYPVIQIEEDSIHNQPIDEIPRNVAVGIPAKLNKPNLSDCGLAVVCSCGVSEITPLNTTEEVIVHDNYIPNFTLRTINYEPIEPIDSDNIIDNNQSRDPLPFLHKNNKPVQVSLNTKKLSVNIDVEKNEIASGDSSKVAVRVENYQSEPVIAEVILLVVDSAFVKSSIINLEERLLQSFYPQNNRINEEIHSNLDQLDASDLSQHLIKYRDLTPNEPPLRKYAPLHTYKDKRMKYIKNTTNITLKDSSFVVGYNERNTQMIDTDVILLVFSLTNRVSFNECSNFLYSTQYWGRPMHSYIVLVGNKTDVMRSVTYEEVRALADQYQLKYIETCAKENRNLIDAFELCLGLVEDKNDVKVLLTGPVGSGKTNIAFYAQGKVPPADYVPTYSNSYTIHFSDLIKNLHTTVPNRNNNNNNNNNNINNNNINNNNIVEPAQNQNIIDPPNNNNIIINRNRNIVNNYENQEIHRSSEFKPTVHFSRAITTENGVFETTIEINNVDITNYSIIAIASTEKEFGVGINNISVESMVINIITVFPKFLNYSDQAFVTIEFENNSKNTFILIVAIRTLSNVILFEGDNKSLGYQVEIGRNQNAILDIPINARDIGEGKIELIIANGDSKLKSEIVTIPVHRPFIGFKFPKEITHFFYNKRSPSSINNKIIIPNEYSSNAGTIQIDIGDPSAVILTQLAKEFLPQRCFTLNQMTSSLVIANSFIDIFARMEPFIENYIEKEKFQIDQWNNLNLKANSEVWLTEKFRDFLGELFKKLENETLSDFGIDIPHALLAYSYINSNLCKKVELKLRRLFEALQRKVDQFKSKKQTEITKQYLILFCCSAFVLDQISPINEQTIIDWLKSRFFDLPIECFGWILPIVFRYKVNNVINRNSPECLVYAERIIFHFEKAMIKTDNGFVTFGQSELTNQKKNNIDIVLDNNPQWITYSNEMQDTKDKKVIKDDDDKEEEINYLKVDLHRSAVRTDAVILNGLILSYGNKHPLVKELSKTLFNSYSPITMKPYTIHEASWIALALNTSHAEYVSDLSPSTEYPSTHLSVKLNNRSFVFNIFETPKASWIGLALNTSHAEYDSSLSPATPNIHHSLSIPLNSIVNNNNNNTANKINNNNKNNIDNRKIKLSGSNNGNDKNNMKNLLEISEDNNKNIELNFIKENIIGTGRSFYRIFTNILPKDVRVEELNDRGVQITRSYQLFPIEEKDIGRENFKLNQNILVTVDITISNKNCENVTIVDHIPACFEYFRTISEPSPFPKIIRYHDIITGNILIKFGRNLFVNVIQTLQRKMEICFAAFQKPKHIPSWFKSHFIDSDNVQIYSENLKVGKYQYQYIVKAVHKGSFIAAPSYLKLQNDPFVCAHSSTQTLSVVK